MFKRPKTLLFIYYVSTFVWRRCVFVFIINTHCLLAFFGWFVSCRVISFSVVAGCWYLVFGICASFNSRSKNCGKNPPNHSFYSNLLEKKMYKEQGVYKEWIVSAVWGINSRKPAVNINLQCSWSWSYPYIISTNTGEISIVNVKFSL